MRRLLTLVVGAPLLLGGSAAIVGASDEVQCSTCFNTTDTENCSWSWTCLCHRAHSFEHPSGDPSGWLRGAHYYVDCGPCSSHAGCSGSLVTAAVKDLDQAIEEETSVEPILDEYRSVLAVNLEAGTISVRDCEGKIVATRELLPSQLDDFVAS